MTKKAMLPQRLVKHPGNVMVLRDLLDCLNRLLLFNMERNSTFLQEVIPSLPLLLKIANLQFSESILGRILYPDLYPDPKGKEEDVKASPETRQDLLARSER